MEPPVIKEPQVVSDKPEPVHAFFNGRILSLRDALFIIRERWILALLLALLVSVGYASWQLRTEPLYESYAVLRIDPIRENIINITEVVNSTMIAKDMDNHLQQLNSKTFLKRVSATLDPGLRELMREPYLVDGQGPTAEGILASSRSFRADGNALQLRIGARHRNRNVCRELANRMATEYLKYVSELQRKRNRKAIEWLQTQASEQKRKVAEAERKAHEYLQKNNLLSIDGNREILVSRISSLTASLSQLNMEVIDIDTQLGQIEKARQEQTPLLNISAVSESPAVASAWKELTRQRDEREVLFEEYLERHPVMIANENRIKHASKRMDEALGQVTITLENRRREHLDRRSKFQDELQKAKEDGHRLEEMELEYKFLLRNKRSAENAYDQLHNRLNQTLISSQLEDTKVRIIDEAPAGWKVEPIPEVITRKAAYLFLGCFILLPLLLEVLDNRVKTQWDIQNFLGAELIGEIPQIKRRKAAEIPRMVLENQDDTIVENFRALYTHLQIRSKVPTPKAIIVTSTAQSEGKSFVSSNLSSMLGRHGIKTLLIDCDFRRPRQHRDFLLKNDRGVIRWFELGETLDPKEKVSEVEVLGIQNIGERFDLLRAGGTSKNATEIIRDERFARLIEACKREYEVIIIDTPPAGLFPDALLLGEYANEVVYVCMHNAVSRQRVRFFLQQLENAGIDIVGVVWNMMRRYRNSGYGYSSGYGYYNYRARDKYYRAREAEGEELDSDKAAELAREASSKKGA